MDILLIHPPAAKPAEPPLGAAVLLAHLKSSGFKAELLDANLGAYLHLLDTERLGQAAGASPSRALSRAIDNTPRSLNLLRSPKGATSMRAFPNLPPPTWSGWPQEKRVRCFRTTFVSGCSLWSSKGGRGLSPFL